ncbi:MAG TPA: nucleotide exchange factor GrpE [Pyrinomonadaceae bacterium]|jgi:molecular chaperone GrpE
MINKNRQTPSRIPIRFLDEEENAARKNQASGKDEDDAGELTPDELGRASIYEDATEMQRRIDRGAEQDNTQGRDEADDADTAGGPNPSEVEESRNDLDTTTPSTDSTGTNRGATGGGGDAGQSPRKAETASGPVMAELVATRAELRRVESQLQKLSEERADYLDKLARRQADFENYRKRMERERHETYNRVVGDVVGRLLPVLDNLQRALAAEDSVQKSESEEFRHFLHGVELISKQLSGVFADMGVEPVATVGQRFDPHVHEAIAAEESDEFVSDTVIAEIVRGYRLGDKLLRPAMVKVAK